MGRIANERHVHFKYTPEFITHWKNQSEEFQTLCTNIGAPFGYSGQNVFLVFFVQYMTHQESGNERVAFERSI